VHLCVLAHLLTRVAENRAETGWAHIRERVERITLTELTIDRASVLQTKKLTRAEADFFNCCSILLPSKIVQVTTT
jgi:hypothetical protein